jgi:hypothetical protein
MTNPVPSRHARLLAGRCSRSIVLLAALAFWVSNPLVRAADERDPFEGTSAADEDPFERLKAAPLATSIDGSDDASPTSPLDDAIYDAPRQATAPLQINFQIPPRPQPGSSASVAPPPEIAAQSKDPCAAAVEKPLSALGIYIGLPSGELPVDHAAACWDSVNQTSGPLAGARSWPGYVYYWDATSLCYRPLYFEEINLERYGYGCCACLQPAASAAHFFGTVPALPYCMAVDCPCECVYTLGHYRPGSCPPWRRHWPPCDPLAVAAEGGVLTGMIFLIP